MKKTTKILALILTIALLFSSLAAAFAHGENTPAYADESTLVAGEDYVVGELLFNLKGSDNQSVQIQSVEEDFGLHIVEEIDQSALEANAQANSLGEDHVTLYRATYDAQQASVFEVCKALNKLPYIQDAEPNYLYAPEEFNMPTDINSSVYRSEQKWYFDNMNITETWQKYSNLGEGVVVCVIDNGLNFEHQEIDDNLWSDGNGHYGYNAEFNNNDIYGKLANGPAHGSHCAGIIAMEGSNGGAVGVAPKAKIMACNAVSTSSGMFSNANLIKSLEYAVENGADVISMSLGGYAFSLNTEKALTRASLSAVILCAAGNEAYSADECLHYPSASAAVIGVMALGAYSNTNTLSDYSNYDTTGRYYQVAAPGTDIYSIAALSKTGYTEMSGTSMATPFMAGIAALYRSEHPELSAPEARRAIIDASGEMVAGYYSSVSGRLFEKAAPYTMLETTPAAEQTVTLNDRLVARAVREALHVDTYYSFTNYDLECISYLDLRGTSFKNYAALAPLTKLTCLNLSDTGMTDADAAALAAYLPDTTLVFDVSDNALTNLNLFKNYSGYLSRLTASGNQLTDISGISGFTMLSDLDVSSNKLSDITPVATLSGLTLFYAPGNLIEDVSPIIGLSDLEEVYFGNYNPNLSDMFGETYFLTGSLGNRISSLEPFMALTSASRLHYINLSYNYVNRDKQFNYRAAKLMQTMEEICRYHKFNSIFGDEVAYKLVLSPFAKGDLIFANDIAFKNDRNFATISLGGGSFAIPYTVLPANANMQTGVRFTVRDSSIAFVNSQGVVYPKAAGSTYITLTLESGAVRTFFLTVKESAVIGASILNPTTFYTAGTSYTALVYTTVAEEIRLLDQNGNSFGQYDAGGKYCYHLTDKNGNAFQKWLIPLCAQTAGDYEIIVSARGAQSESFSQTIASFPFPVYENTGYDVYGYIYSYNSFFDTTVSLLAADDTLLQQLTLRGGFDNSNAYRFSNVAAGVYTIVIERDGYKPYYIKNIVVNGDTFVDDDIDVSAASFAACAGDLNGDGSIDIADISVLLAEENYAKDSEAAASYVCDLNGDSSVNVEDLAIIITNHAK